ncbi:phosphoglycerate mutase-like protein [Pisolithus marmoratus]|nr:phosphoglycerate mutase-like protein [Pisolithus marmoratus]
MYLPAVLSLLQASLSSFTGLPEVDPPTNVRPYQLDRLGIVSPYHDRAHVPGVETELPRDCTVDQVMLLHRHGSRGPTWENEYIQKLVETLDNSSQAIRKAHLPPNLRFLKDGYKSDLVPHQLTAIGRQQLFDHGVDFALQYPTLSTNVVLSSTVQRVVDSAHYFGYGFFGGDIDKVDFVTVDELDVPVNWITPWNSCPKYSEDEGHAAASAWNSKYVPPITQRLSRQLGVDLSDDDTRGALYACPFDLAAHNESPWCAAFHNHELRSLEYEYDLLMSGYMSRNKQGPTLGSVYVNKLIDRFTNTTGHAKELYLEFGHDTSILLVLSAMVLNRDPTPLPIDHIRTHRKFRTSEQTPFAAQMVWERFSCKKSFHGPQIRLLLNSATYPLTICQKSFKDKEFGSCSLKEFIRANELSRKIHYNNTAWNTSCVD